MLRKYLVLLMAAFGLAILLPMLAQENPPAANEIEKAIEQKDFKKADSLVKRDLALFYSQGQLDTIPTYLHYAGKIVYEQLGTAKASAAVFAFIDTLEAHKGSPKILITACRRAAEFFANLGQNSDGYRSCERALAYAQSLTERKQLEIAQCEYNLGVYAQRLGNFTVSRNHHRVSLGIREKEPGATPEDLYFSNNAMGGIFWYASLYDSAAACYQKALENVAKMDDKPINRFYRPAMIHNNLAALYSAEGKTSEGIRSMELSIDHFQQFIATPEPHEKKQDAQVGILEAIDNLAGLYKEIGDYGKAGDLLMYSYQQKLNRYNSDNPGIFISEILMGQHYNSINEYDSAMIYLTKGLDKLQKAEGDYLFWSGDAHFNLAMVYANRKENEKAAFYYQQADSLYEASYQGTYDNVYMDFLRNASLFYAKNNQYEKAMAGAKKVYDYLRQVGQEKSLQAFYQLLNIAEVNYLSARYSEAIRFSRDALTVVNEKVTEGMTVLDSVKIDVFKPKAILLNERSEYAMRPVRDSLYLAGVSARLDQALQILEKRKVLIDDPESINILIADNTELIDFAKQIEWERYERGGQTARLDRFINLHESGLYNRIRSRLDKKKAVRFGKLPVSLQEEEQKLKAAIPISLSGNKPNNELINDYLTSVKNWESFLDKVKTEYPVYYNMRYASLFRPLPSLQSAIPANTTLIRYFFVGDQLLALVADSSSKHMVRLEGKEVEKNIALLLQQSYLEKTSTPVLNALYQALWTPLAPSIHNQKLIIIPDGILFNLNFELLTPDPITNYRELAQKGLLAKHDIVYHYSLFMLENQAGEEAISSNYVGFAPGFSDDLKKAYVATVKDSVNLDFQYLSLLPQPNTNKLAKKFKSILGGQAYLNLASTPSVFRKNAGGHKIIHIGTHAEYNNIYPERSRLIFAKTPSVIQDTNSLFLHDIYNCDVQSDLTLLTACETGRPGFQDGEGMVSLAHAFNYAGSRSILTGLWKIDESSSSRITESFISHLKKGLSSDEALRQAKIDYLTQNPDRVLAPAYWSGLVLMGRPGTIDFAQSGWPWWWFAIGGVLLAGVAGWWIRRKK